MEWGCELYDLDWSHWWGNHTQLWSSSVPNSSIEILRLRIWHSLVVSGSIMSSLDCLILPYWQILAKGIQDIFMKCAWFIIHEQLDMQELSPKWVQKCLNSDQKQHQVDISKLILWHFQQSHDSFVEWTVPADKMLQWSRDQTKGIHLSYTQINLK